MPHRLSCIIPNFFFCRAMTLIADPNVCTLVLQVHKLNTKHLPTIS